MRLDPTGADWDDLRHFLALARTGSIRAAGTAIGVSHSTVTRRVQQLERRLGVRLFDRHRGGFSLTEAGQQMMDGALRVEAEVGAVLRDLTGRDARLEGPVRVTTGDEFLAAWLIGALAPWCAANPGVELCVQVDPRYYDLAKGEADLAVRVLVPGQDPPDHLAGRRVAPLMFANYVATEHAHRLDPAGPDARWIGIPDTRAAEVLLRGTSYPRLPMWGEFTPLAVIVRAAELGLGLALLPTYAGDVTPTLTRLPTADLRQVADLWVLHHPGLRGNARVRSAREALQAAFADQAALFEGGAPAHPSGPRSHRA